MNRTYSAAVASSSMVNQASNLIQSTNTAEPNYTISSIPISTVIDAFHPFCLQISDNPGIALVTKSLTSENYQQWSRSVK